MGTDPGLLAEAAAAFIELGAAGVDFNFGCPSRRVVSGGAGGGALKNPQWMRKILATTRRMLPTAIPVSAKIRTGWHSPEEMDRIIPEILSDGAVSFLTVHFRTVTEQYQPVPGRERRWARAIQLAAGIPVVLNVLLYIIDIFGGIITFPVKWAQPKNAPTDILTRLVGRVNDAILVSENAYSPIVSNNGQSSKSNFSTNDDAKA